MRKYVERKLAVVDRSGEALYTTELEAAIHRRS